MSNWQTLKWSFITFGSLLIQLLMFFRFSSMHHSIPIQYGYLSGITIPLDSNSTVRALNWHFKTNKSTPYLSNFSYLPTVYPLFVIINYSASCHLTTFMGIFKAETAKNPPKSGKKMYNKFSCIFHKCKVKQPKNSIWVSNDPSYWT